MTDILAENLQRKWEIKFSKYARKWWVYNPILNEFYYFASHKKAIEYFRKEVNVNA